MIEPFIHFLTIISNCSICSFVSLTLSTLDLITEAGRGIFLFFYSQKSIDINFIYQSVDLIQELDSKKRKIRSFRGFFLYALEIMAAGNEVEVLKTNLQPFFWRKVKNIIQQNKKGALQEFLFGAQTARGSSSMSSAPLEEMIKNLQNQLDSLQQRVIHLENQIIVKDRKLNVLSEAQNIRFKTSSNSGQAGLYLEGPKR